MPTKLGDTKISNSHRGFRFEITKRDIENGQPNDPCNCAAARALKRHTGAKEVRVHHDVTLIKIDEDKALRYKTPPRLKLETVVFDRDGNFYPGEYDLDPAPLPQKTKRTTSASAPVRSKKQGRAYRGIPNVRPTASQYAASVKG